MNTTNPKKIKTWGKLRCSGRVINSSCSNSGTRCDTQYTKRIVVIIDVCNNRYRNAFVFTTVGKYLLSFVKWIFRTDQPSHDEERKKSGVMTVIFPRETVGSVAFLSAAALYQ